MKKLLFVLTLSVCAAGCGGPASQSGVWEHDTLYRSVDHMRFSWGGYKDPGVQEEKKSSEQGWWGKPVPTEPGK